jgi:hypothetical protein
VNTVESIVREQAVLNGEEIATTARDFADKIGELADASAEREPDLLRSDSVLSKLAKLFETATGQPYAPERQKEVYAQGAQRYAQATPPGYKDDKKGEPGKYGDLLIWFQMIDHAKAKQKPMIFVTGDVKEDWLQQHRGETLGPRPELRQEMMSAAGVPFWIYTTPRFLEFAKQFLGLKFDTKKAETEFEKIEKQDKQVTESGDLPAVTYHYSDFPVQMAGGWGWNKAWDWNSGAFFGQPNDSAYGNVSYAGWTAPADAGPKQEFLQLLPLNGAVFNPPTGRWTCKIATAPSDGSSDRALYTLEFQPQDHSKPSRTLKLWVSLPVLEKDSDWKYKRAISNTILKWLLTNQLSGEAGLLP